MSAEINQARITDRHQLWLQFPKDTGWMCGGQYPTRQSALDAAPTIQSEWLSQAEPLLAGRIHAGSWHVVKRPADHGGSP